MARGSRFTPTLVGPITVPAAWQDKVVVSYSESKNPKRDDIYTKVKYLPGDTPHVNPAGAEAPNWKLEADIAADGWKNIHSFKMELKSGVTWVQGQRLEMVFKMKAPEVGEVAPELLVDDKNTEITLAAWNSFAMTTNGILPTEPRRVGIVMIKTPPAPPSSTTPPEPEKPKDSVKPKVSPSPTVIAKVVPVAKGPRTGDDSLWIVYAIVFAGALAGVVLLVRKQILDKKSGENQKDKRNRK